MGNRKVLKTSRNMVAHCGASHVTHPSCCSLSAMVLMLQHSMQLVRCSTRSLTPSSMYAFDSRDIRVYTTYSYSTTSSLNKAFSASNCNGNFNLFLQFFPYRSINGVRRWGGQGVQTPQTGKNCCRKMMLFPKFLFLATNVHRKQIKIQFFN